MKFGITINIGNYNSLKCESSEHETLSECYMEIYDVIMDWEGDFDSIEWWKNKLLDKIKNSRC